MSFGMKRNGYPPFGQGQSADRWGYSGGLWTPTADIADHWYPLTQAEPVVDKIGGQNGTAYNSPTFGADRYGNANNATVFDGVDQYIDLNVKTLTGQGARSVACWFKSIAVGGVFIGELAPSTSQKGLLSGISTSTGMAYGLISDGTAPFMLFPLATDLDRRNSTYYHYAFTWDGTTGANKGIVYINGTPIVTGTADNTTQNGISNYNTQICGYNGINNLLAGLIHDVVINKSQAWTQAEVTLLATENY